MDQKIEAVTRTAAGGGPSQIARKAVLAISVVLLTTVNVGLSQGK